MTYRVAARLIAMIEPCGLPFKHVMFARKEYIVKWDAQTGEVSTIEYGSGNQITKIWVDEYEGIPNRTNISN